MKYFSKHGRVGKIAVSKLFTAKYRVSISLFDSNHNMRFLRVVDIAREEWAQNFFDEIVLRFELNGYVESEVSNDCTDAISNCDGVVILSLD